MIKTTSEIPVVRTVTAVRYVTPLREGGSLPAIVEADDDGLYVLKFRGAGQGHRALIAELVAGEIGRALGLPVPEIVFVEVDPALGRSEPDSEIRALITASAGLNLALDYLPGSIDFDPLIMPPPDDQLASDVVWFDAYVTNVDRTPRNPNMLVWHRRLYLIDHGSALYFHHSWADYLGHSRGRFAQIKDHALLPAATSLRAADEELSKRLNVEILNRVVSLIPGEWLGDEPALADPSAHREAYAAYLGSRLADPRPFVEEAINAQSRRV